MQNNNSNLPENITSQNLLSQDIIYQSQNASLQSTSNAVNVPQATLGLIEMQTDNQPPFIYTDISYNANRSQPPLQETNPAKRQKSLPQDVIHQPQNSSQQSTSSTTINVLQAAPGLEEMPPNNQSSTIFTHTSGNTNNQPPLQEANSAKRQKQCKPTYSIPTYSRYDILNETADPDNELSNSEVKIPPFTVIGKNYQLLIQDISKIVQHEYTTKSRKNEIKIQFTSIDDFRNFRKFSESNNIQFYTYQDPSKKCFPVMLKNIPASISEIDIYNELFRLQYPIISVRRLYDKSRKPLQTCALDLQNSKEGKEILHLKTLFHCLVNIQPRTQRSSPIQCKNCQRFDHSQANCRLTPRCVKCNQNHHYSLCNKPQNSLPICVNCNQNHTANYRGCPFFKQALNNKTSKFNNTAQDTIHNLENTNTQPKTFTFHNTDFPPLQKPPNAWSNTYSNTARNSQNINNINTSSLNISQLITTIVTQVISSLIPQIQQIIESLLNKQNV